MTDSTSDDKRSSGGKAGSKVSGSSSGDAKESRSGEQGPEKGGSSQEQKDKSAPREGRKKRRSRRRRPRRRSPDSKDRRTADTEKTGGSKEDNKVSGETSRGRTDRGGREQDQGKESKQLQDKDSRKSSGQKRTKSKRTGRVEKKDDSERGRQHRSEDSSEKKGSRGRRRKRTDDSGKKGEKREGDKGRGERKSRWQGKRSGERSRRSQSRVLDKESGFFLPDEAGLDDEERLADFFVAASREARRGDIPDDETPESDWEKEEVFNTARVQIRGELRGEEVDCGDLILNRGDRLVVEGDRGQAMAVVLTPSVRKVLIDPRLRSVLRGFDEGDRRQEARNRRRAREAFGVGKDRISKRSLEMKLVGVDYLHSGNKAVFYFTADGRVDFRELIRDLARNLRIRIEMRQIGIRDEARLVGGIGTCGRALCCNTFLEEFDQISIRMAKDQKIVLNPQKISGQCGRLKCCLAYEHHIYRELGKGLPRCGKRIETPKGIGRIMDVDVLTRKIRVSLEDGQSEVFAADDLGIGRKDGEVDDFDPSAGES